MNEAVFFSAPSFPNFQTQDHEHTDTWVMGTSVVTGDGGFLAQLGIEAVYVSTWYFIAKIFYVFFYFGLTIIIN